MPASLARRPPSGAARAVAVINRLTHTGDFAGRPFDLRPWQERIIRRLFKTGRNGKRIYRTCLLMLPRKNGKTEIAAAIAVYCLLFDSVQGEIYCAAADRDQAAKVFLAMVSMIRADPVLDAMCEIVESQKRIVHRKSGSFCRAISAEAYSKHGFNASVVIYDELHCAPNRELWDVLVTSQGARAEPLMIAISTAGYDRHSILWELYSHAKRVLENPALDPTFLPLIFEAPEGADWTDERVWKQANPALGDFRSLDDMRILCQRAQAIPAQEMTFRQLYLSQWTESVSRWLSLASWDACEQPIDRTALRNRACYVGLDLSATKDLTAAVAVFPDDEGDGFAVLAAFFCPKESLRERVRRDRVPYDQWDGPYLTTTKGDTVDYQAVRRLLNDWAEEFDVKVIGCDPWNATDLLTQLAEQDGFEVVKVRQGMASLSAPTKSLETTVLNRTLRHDGQPVLRWNIGNVVVEKDNNENIRPSKAVSTEKIDGVIALVIAIDQMNRNNAVPPKTFQMIVMGGSPR